jgi:hypothetical protein
MTVSKRLLAEGVETALSYAEMFGVVTWAVLGKARFTKVAIPSDVRHLHLCADLDSVADCEQMAKYVMRIEAMDGLAGIRGGRGGFWEDRGYGRHLSRSTPLSQNERGTRRSADPSYSFVDLWGFSRRPSLKPSAPTDRP